MKALGNYSNPEDTYKKSRRVEVEAVKSLWIYTGDRKIDRHIYTQKIEMKEKNKDKAK